MTILVRHATADEAEEIYQGTPQTIMAKFPHILSYFYLYLDDDPFVETDDKFDPETLPRREVELAQVYAC